MHWTDGLVAAEHARTCAEPLLHSLSSWMLNVYDISGKDPRNHFFEHWQQLLGFEIGWAKLDIASRECREYGVNPSDCEIVMMRASGLSECHLHEHGSSTLFVLGEGYGSPAPSGGILVADYIEGKRDYLLEPIRHKTGDIVEVPAGKIHAFFADPGGQLALIGFVRPRIKRGDEFDVVPFDYVSHIPSVRVRKRD